MPLLQVLHKKEKEEKRIPSSKKRRYLLHGVRNDHKSLLHFYPFRGTGWLLCRVFERLFEWETSYYSTIP